MKRGIHDRAIQRIALQPEIIGLDNIAASATEVNLFSPHGDLMAQPDVVLIGKQNQVYVVEYKDNGHKRLAEKADKQKKKVEEWFSMYRTIYFREKIRPKTKVLGPEDLEHSVNPRQIALRPSRIKIPNIIASSMGVNLFDSHGRVIASPDYLFLHRTGAIYLVYEGREANNDLPAALAWFWKLDINSMKDPFIPGMMLVNGQDYPELKKPYKQGRYDREVRKRRR